MCKKIVVLLLCLGLVASVCPVAAVSGELLFNADHSGVYEMMLAASSFDNGLDVCEGFDTIGDDYRFEYSSPYVENYDFITIPSGCLVPIEYGQYRVLDGIYDYTRWDLDWDFNCPRDVGQFEVSSSPPPPDMYLFVMPYDPIVGEPVDVSITSMRDDDVYFNIYVDGLKYNQFGPYMLNPDFPVITLHWIAKSGLHFIDVRWYDDAGNTGTCSDSYTGVVPEGNESIVYEPNPVDPYDPAAVLDPAVIPKLPVALPEIGEIINRSVITEIPVLGNFTGVYLDGVDAGGQLVYDFGVCVVDIVEYPLHFVTDLLTEVILQYEDLVTGVIGNVSFLMQGIGCIMNSIPVEVINVASLILISDILVVALRGDF